MQAKKKNSKIHLTGYFDSNFGDDMMMKLVVRNLPDITFVIENTVDTPIFAEQNVVAASREECNKLEKLVVTGSGFMINNKAALITELIWFVKKYHAGDYLLGCNIEPLSNCIKRFLIGKKLNKFKLITCRDKKSYSWLCKYARCAEIHYLPDLLFSIPDEWLPEIKSPNKLGISLMHRYGDHENCEYYQAMAEIADEWISRTGKDVLLMAFDTGVEDDLFACRAVKSLMRFPERVEIVAHKDCSEIPEAFAKCEKIIGARFHSIVLALRMGIKLFPIIFREKARNLLNDIEYPFAVSDIDSIDKKALSAFLSEEQDAYRLEKDIYISANEHTRILKHHLEH